MRDQTLLLIDASNYLYRSYYAMPNLRGPNGEPTGALYGIINMLRRVRREYPAKYIACIFDAYGKTFRNVLYSDYKANRIPMPDDLCHQLKAIRKTVRLLGWPLFSVEGVEADDVIGTLAIHGTKLCMKVVIASGDKDLAQLVNENITIVNTMNNEVLDPMGVISKFGVPAEKIVDYLSLVGDVVDGIPGVSRCGPKTAIKWLKQYGSLDGVIKNAGAFKGVLGKNLRNVLDWLPTARCLVTVRTDCDLTNHIYSIKESLCAQPEAQVEMIEIYNKYGFKH